VTKGVGRLPMSSAQGLYCILGYRAGWYRSARIQIFGFLRVNTARAKWSRISFYVVQSIVGYDKARAVRSLRITTRPLSRQAPYTSSSRSEPLASRSSRFHLHRKVPSTLRTGGRVLPIVACSWC